MSTIGSHFTFDFPILDDAVMYVGVSCFFFLNIMRLWLKLAKRYKKESKLSLKRSCQRNLLCFGKKKREEAGCHTLWTRPCS